MGHPPRVYTWFLLNFAKFKDFLDLSKFTGLLLILPNPD